MIAIHPLLTPCRAVRGRRHSLAAAAARWLAVVLEV